MFLGIIRQEIGSENLKRDHQYSLLGFARPLSNCCYTKLALSNENRQYSKHFTVSYRKRKTDKRSRNEKSADWKLLLKHKQPKQIRALRHFFDQFLDDSHTVIICHLQRSLQKPNQTHKKHLSSANIRPP